MNDKTIMTVGDLKKRLDDYDPKTKVVLLSSDRDDLGWALRDLVDEETGSWLMLYPGHEVPVRVED